MQKNREKMNLKLKNSNSYVNGDVSIKGRYFCDDRIL